ncbi:hypothetical protein QE152_g35770 [Popillia japonica]|uniref:Uncharacterized protein n=1 Tax=Popillia japonica TaxID=7064 RepID=A0AAW1IF48_POPJA
MPPVKGKMHAYTEEAINNAIEDVLRGTPVATAAKKHSVPRATHSNKAIVKTPRYRRMGPESILKKDEEDLFVDWIVTIAKVGFPITRPELLDSVQQLIQELQRENPFSGNRPVTTYTADIASTTQTRDLTDENQPENFTERSSEGHLQLEAIAEEFGDKTPTKVVNRLNMSEENTDIENSETLTNKKEKLPSVATSKQWQEYDSKKTQIKKENEERQQERARERQLKKENMAIEKALKEQLKTKKDNRKEPEKGN